MTGRRRYREPARLRAMTAQSYALFETPVGCMLFYPVLQPAHFVRRHRFEALRDLQILPQHFRFFHAREVTVTPSTLMA